MSEPSNPWVAGVSSLFTVEFYRQVDRHLAPGGVLAQWIQAYEFDMRLLSSVVEAVRVVFPDVTIYNVNGSDLILIAAREPAEPRAGRLFEHPSFAARLASVGIASPDEFDRRRVVGPAALGALFGGERSPPNSDYFPIVDIGAPGARFKGSSAVDAIQLLAAPVPVADLVERRAPPATSAAMPSLDVVGIADRWADARAAQVFVTGPDFARGAPIPPLPSSRAIAQARVVLVDCVTPASATLAWDGVVMLAGDFAHALGAEDFERFVATIERSACRVADARGDRRLGAALPRGGAPRRERGGRGRRRAGGARRSHRPATRLRHAGGGGRPRRHGPCARGAATAGNAARARVHGCADARRLPLRGGRGAGALGAGNERGRESGPGDDAGSPRARG